MPLWTKFASVLYRNVKIHDDISPFYALKYKYGAFSLLLQKYHQQMNRASLLIPGGNLKAAGHNLINDNNDNQSSGLTISS